MSILTDLRNWRSPRPPAAVKSTLTRPAYVSAQTFSPAVNAFCSLSPVSDALARAHSEVKQLKFLLANAPMIDAPTGPPSDIRARLQSTRSPFAYINPKTMSGILFQSDFYRLSRANEGFTVFSGSSTKWVMLSTMPEGRVIYSSLPIPGIEKILAQ